MGTTPSVIRKAFVPLRHSEIAALARTVYSKFGLMTLDEIAETEHIFLRRVRGSNTSKAGFCCVFESEHQKRIRSVVHPQTAIYSFCEQEKSIYPAIIINPYATDDEREVFWHEYYHLFYSPNRRGGANYFGGYSTAGVLDRQEEQRADLFAACVLIPEVRADDDIEKLQERYSVSRRLAQLRLQKINL